MSKLSEEIKAICEQGTFSDYMNNVYFKEGFIRARDAAAQLVEKRKAELEEQINALLDKHRPAYDGDYVDGRTDGINAILNMEDA